MKKFFTLVTLLLACICNANADDITKEQAMHIAEQFMNDNGMNCYSRSKGMKSSAPELEIAESTDGHYVVNNSNGFVVVASDDAVPQQVLGYCTSGCFDANDIPDGMRDMLDDFDSQIKSLKECGSGTQTAATTFREPISYETPLWGQSAPYNLKCPLVAQSKRAVTGCVATAAAEVMYYNKWPQNFLWDNMTYTYDRTSSKESCEAVASLMSDIGTAVGMHYTAASSGANTGNLCRVFVSKYDYSSDALLLYRFNYTSEEWEGLVYNNLKEYGPMIYNGKGDSGHCFVCDGYKDGYFHFNWGWCGRCNDTYFSLCSLKPGETGEGGNKTRNYSCFQSAIFNLHPDNGIEHHWWARSPSIAPNKADFDSLTLISTNTAVAGDYFYVSGTMKNSSDSRLLRELEIMLVDVSNPRNIYSATNLTADAQPGEEFQYSTILKANANPGTYMVVIRYVDIYKFTILRGYKVKVIKGNTVQEVNGYLDDFSTGITEVSENNSSTSDIKKICKNGKIYIIQNDITYDQLGHKIK